MRRDPELRTGREGRCLATTDDIDIIFQPSGPGVDESQEDILGGFIRAALNP